MTAIDKEHGMDDFNVFNLKSIATKIVVHGFYDGQKRDKTFLVSLPYGATFVELFAYIDNSMKKENQETYDVIWQGYIDRSNKIIWQ